MYSVHWNSKHKSAHPVLVNLYVHTCHEWDKWDIQNCYPLHRRTHKASSFCFETPRHKSDKLLITVTVPYWTISHVWRNPCIDYKRVDIVTVKSSVCVPGDKSNTCPHGDQSNVSTQWDPCCEYITNTVTVPYWTISRVRRNPCIDSKRVDNKI